MKKFSSMRIGEGGKQEKINIYNANGSHKKGFSSHLTLFFPKK